MFFTKIEWKNIFAYGEEVQTLEYDSTGKLILLKGQSGSGKTAILSLPVLVLYGKLANVNKTSIANRVNKNGWIRGTLIKNNHTYVIERKFTPNALTVFKDDVNIENYGTKDAQAYIDNEIIEIPQATFNNMISISMKKFKSFLTMSPADRKQIIDRVFNLEIVNVVYENLKKDMRDLGNSINSDNTSLFQLNQTIMNANQELIKIQEKQKTQETQQQIDENNIKITENNAKLQKLQEGYKQYAQHQQEINMNIQTIKRGQIENTMSINQLQEKINLYNQEKCPTCGTSFTGANYDEIKQKLQELKAQKDDITLKLNQKLQELTNNVNQVNEYLQKITAAVQTIQADTTKLQNSNYLIQQSMKVSGEYQAVQNIINKTTEQITTIKTALEEKNQNMIDMQNLCVVYSIEGVKQKVINNYLPLLNKEIAQNLDLLNFPYQLEFDSKFDPNLKDIGMPVPVDTLSDGEMTRVDIVVLCSLFKLLKRRYPNINILSIDELVSFLDVANSQILLKFLNNFAKSMNLNIFVVSHVNIDTECFDKCIEVTREENRFAHIREENLMM